MDDISSITCSLDYAKSKNVLEVPQPTSNTFDKILLASPEISTITIPEPSNTSNTSLLHLLLEEPKEINDIEFESLISYLDPPKVLEPQKIESEDEKILLQIKINYAKLNFLQAQHYILNEYLTNFYKNAPGEVKTKYKVESEFNFHILHNDTTLQKTDPVKNFIDKFSDYTTPSDLKGLFKKHPNVFEVKKYLDILKLNK